MHKLLSGSRERTGDVQFNYVDFKDKKTTGSRCGMIYWLEDEAATSLGAVCDTSMNPACELVRFARLDR
jgi:hypothetical protein